MRREDSIAGFYLSYHENVLLHQDVPRINSIFFLTRSQLFSKRKAHMLNSTQTCLSKMLSSPQKIAQKPIAKKKLPCKNESQRRRRIWGRNNQLSFKTKINFYLNLKSFILKWRANSEYINLHEKNDLETREERQRSSPLLYPKKFCDQGRHFFPNVT